MTITAANYTDHIEISATWPNFDLDLVASSVLMFYMGDQDCKRGIIEYHMVRANHNLAVSV